MAAECSWWWAFLIVWPTTGAPHTPAVALGCGVKSCADQSRTYSRKNNTPFESCREISREKYTALSKTYIELQSFGGTGEIVGGHIKGKDIKR